MKNITLILSFLFVGVTASANSDKINSLPYNYGEAFIFVEGGVEFAVYPNGEFDFYYNPRFINTSIVNISSPGMNISYNAGYNYDAYVQYDDYGAVIQIENVPVYYDYYGRLIQAGDVIINYNRRGRIVQVGGLQIRYNSFNRPVQYIGYINTYNTRYIPRPWHQYYVRPHANYQVVYSQPYRAYYEPVRIDYIQYNTYYQNNNYYYNKNNFYRPGQQVTVYNHGRRTSSQRAIEPAGRSSDNNITRRSNALAREKSAPVRSRTSATRSSTAKDMVEARTRSNMQQHEAAVRAQRTSSSVNNDTPVQTRSRNVVESRSTRSTTASAQQTRTVERAAPVTRNSTPRATSSVRRRASSQERISAGTRNETNRTTVRRQSTISRSATPVSRETSASATRRTSGGRG